MDSKDIERMLRSGSEVKDTIRLLEKSFNSMLKETFEWGFMDFGKKVRLKIVPDLSFNAAAQKGIFNEIKINIGVVPLLQALAINVAKLEYIWPDILFDTGFDQDESVRNVYDIINASYFDLDKYEIEDSHISLMMDNDVLGSRSEMSYSIYKFMWYFLIFHEYSHLLCGHAELLGINHLKEINLNEIGLLEVDGKNRTIRETKRQWAELEADILGSLLMVEVLKMEALPDSVNGDGTIENGKIELLKGIFFSIGLMFLMFSYKTDSLKIYRLKEHPHPGVRIANVFDVIANYLNASKIMGLDTAQKIMEEVLAMLISLGDELGIDVFRVLSDNLDLLKGEILAIQKSVGGEWIDRNRKLMADIIVRLKTKVSMF